MYYGDPPKITTVCIENYCKWYTPYVVKPDGSIDAFTVTYEDLEEHCPPGESCMDSSGHVFNPRAIARMAEARGFRMDDASYELMVGRWVLEVLESYHFMDE